MRLIVTGGRHYGVSDQRDSADVTASATEERATLTRALNAFHARRTITILIHGAATGADALAREWASAQRIATIPFRADWKRRGRKAGPERNARMLTDGKPDAVLAFPGGRGTQDMIRKAMRAGVPVWRVFRPAVLDTSLFGSHDDQRPIERLRFIDCPHRGEWVEEIEEVWCEPCGQQDAIDMAAGRREQSVDRG